MIFQTEYTYRQEQNWIEAPDLILVEADDVFAAVDKAVEAIKDKHDVEEELIHIDAIYDAEVV